MLIGSDFFLDVSCYGRFFLLLLARIHINTTWPGIIHIDARFTVDFFFFVGTCSYKYYLTRYNTYRCEVKVCCRSVRYSRTTPGPVRPFVRRWVRSASEKTKNRVKKLKTALFKKTSFFYCVSRKLDTLPSSDFLDTIRSYTKINTNERTCLVVRRIYPHTPGTYYTMSTYVFFKSHIFKSYAHTYLYITNNAYARYLQKMPRASIEFFSWLNVNRILVISYGIICINTTWRNPPRPYAAHCRVTNKTKIVMIPNWVLIIISYLVGVVHKNHIINEI